MTASRLYKNMNILFILQPCYSGSCPGIILTIDKNHLRIVLLQEPHNLIAQCLIKFHLPHIFRQHQSSQIILAGLYRKVRFKRSDIVSIIPQFAGSLHEERKSRAVYYKIRRSADCQQMIQQCIVRSRSFRYTTDIRSPLPDRERVFQHTEIVYFFQRSAECIVLFSTHFFKTGQQTSLSLQYFQLEIFYFFPIGFRTYPAEERFVPTVFTRITKRSNIRHGNIHIVGEENTV